VVCTVVVAGHLGAILLMIHSRSVRREEATEASLQVILMRQMERAGPTAEAPARKAQQAQRTLRASHGAASATRVRPPEGAPSPTEPPVNEITDWGAAAQDAAEDVLKRERVEGGRRAFGHVFPAPAVPVKPGVFGSDSENHRAGRVDDDGQVFWISDNCYYEFPRGGPPFPLEFRRPRLPACKPPPTGGGSNLFEDLTPPYLKRPPTPAAPR